MLEAIGEALGEPRGALRIAGAHGPADDEELGGDRGRQPLAAQPHQRVEPADGAVEALHGRRERPAAGPCFGEVDHLSHTSHDGQAL